MAKRKLNEYVFQTGIPFSDNRRPNAYWLIQNNVEFIKGGIPEGVEKFKSKYNKDTSYTFKTPGIYAYWCTPHKSMGMIGFVVVGNDKSNLDAIKKLKFYGKSTKIAKELISSL